MRSSTFLAPFFPGWKFITKAVQNEVWDAVCGHQKWPTLLTDFNKRDGLNTGLRKRAMNM